jgi:hypothetical protein
MELPEINRRKSIHKKRIEQKTENRVVAVVTENPAPGQYRVPMN